MKNAKKLLALLLALVMCVGLLASCGKQAADNSASPDNSTAPGNSAAPETYENKIVLGDTTELGGDFRSPGWGGSSAGAADQAVWFLTAGYAVMESDQDGVYQWNQTAVLNHSEVENEDGSITYTVEIAHDLTFSDGTPITAKNYVASILSFSSGDVCADANRSGMSGQILVGFDSFNRYAGPDGDYTSETVMTTVPVVDENGEETGETTEEETANPKLGATKEFSGVRLLDEYTYELTVAADQVTYFAEANAALQPYPMGLFLGEDVDVADDGNGCYLTDNFYEKNADGQYVKGLEILGNRFDVTKYPYSGPYTITEWDEGAKQATLTLNPEYKGNFEGQKPSIETIVYVKVVEETCVGELTSGGVDLLINVTGGELTAAALAEVDGVNYNEVHYQRAGYGKIQFDCDFGPTMFQEVRQAVAYLLNRVEFCQAFTGGYGVVVDGPYSPDFAAYRAVQDDIELTDYSFSPDTAIKVLEDGGWIYNSKGEPYEAGASGVDAVRYKKLTAEEANAVTGDGARDVNKTYASVANTDGVTYKTVEINGEYYMPLAINWFGTQPNSVTDLLGTMLSNSSDLAAAGMVIRSTTGDFNVLLGNIYRMSAMGYEGTPIYGMYNLATGFNSAIYDRSYEWRLDPIYFDYSSNKLYDEYDKAFPYDLENPERLSYEEAVEASGDKLGMDYLSMAMVYNAKTEDEYNQWYQGFIERWNELMPDIPLYSNYYYDVFHAKLENFKTTPFFGANRAIIYANVKGY